uniref:Uncharacterized protein n=1 Tax=Macaca nemestrina TaxID=9545 RepID=A0A2K6CH60_MACNE
MDGCVSNLMVCNLLEDRTEQNSRTALHWACSARQAEIVEFLLQLGVPVNDKGDAASKHRHEIAVVLLEGGADPAAEDRCEATAMHQAAAKDTPASGQGAGFNTQENGGRLNSLDLF